MAVGGKTVGDGMNLPIHAASSPSLWSRRNSAAVYGVCLTLGCRGVQTGGWEPADMLAGRKGGTERHRGTVRVSWVRVQKSKDRRGRAAASYACGKV